MGHFFNRSVDPEHRLTLSGCDNPERVGAVGVQFSLTPSDLRSLKLNADLGTQRENTFLSIGSESNIEDPPNNDLMVIPFSLSRQVDSGFTPDMTRPRVIGFSNFDLNTGQFTIMFDEPMNTDTVTTPVSLFQHQASAIYPKDILTVQSLTCMAPECQNNETITFTLPREELNRVKLSPRICFSASTCWLTIPSPGDFMQDMAGNMLIELPNGDHSITRLLDTFTNDVIGPMLEAYTLNLTSRELILNFDEPVEASSFNITGITIQSERGVSRNDLAYQLVSSTLTPPTDAAEIVILLSDEDVDALQSRPDVASRMSNTYLSMESHTARDLTYQQNQAQAIPSDNALLVDIFEQDRAPPQVRSFDLNLDTNSLIITFTEPILVSSLNLDRVILASSPSGDVIYHINGGSLQQTSLDATSVIAITLLDRDQTFLEVSEDIATGRTDTFLATDDGFVRDTNQLLSVSLPLSQAIQVSTFTSDASPPNVVGFSLDMDTGVAVVTFDDVIIGNTFDVNALTFQSGMFRVPLEWHALSQTSSSNSIADGFEITINFGGDDLNRLKQIRNLTTNSDSSYLTLMATLADDVNGVDVIAITDGNALKASQFTPDSSRPALSRWTFDLNVGQIVMTFTETVDILRLQPSQITLLAGQGSSNSYTLTGFSSLVPPDADFRFAIHLNEQDSNFIKARTTLGTGRDNSFLSFTRNAIQDMNGNDVFAISASNALQVDTYIPDNANPVLRSFSLDTNTGLLQVIFDETVNASTFNVTALTFVNRAFQPTVSYMLADSRHSNTNSAVIDISLTSRDLNALNAIDSLATSSSDTFITATLYTVRDMNKNPLSEITADSALQIALSGYIRDTTSPFLAEFTLNMSSEQLILTFSETVSVNVDATQITLQSEISSSIAGAVLVTLRGGSITRRDGTMIIVQLEEQDANELKRIRSIATSEENTFVWLMSTSVTDPAGNPVMAISENNAQQASLVISDSIPPFLTSFTLNLASRELVLFFDETVDSGSFTSTFVTLQDVMSEPMQSVTLGSFSRTNSGDGTEIVIELSDTDFNAIAATFPLATMSINTYISLREGVVRDTAGVASSEVPVNNAIQITNHTADDVRPSLDEFIFDLDGGILTLVFSESVNITSFDATQITLQNQPNSPTYMHTLRGGVVTRRENTIIDVTLLSNDLNRIKQLTQLASIRSNTYISITSATVSDMNRNLVNAVSMSNALLSQSFIPDITGPIIQGFNLDYNSGDMILYFDEIINLSTFLVDGITLQNSDSGSGMSHTLFDSIRLNSGLETIAQVRLSRNDLNELKRSRICTSSGLCHLSASNNVVRDVPDNRNAEISNSFARNVGGFLPDLTRPRLLTYTEFDLDGGIFTLEFSETVDVSTLNISHVILDSDYLNTTYTFEFDELGIIGGDNFNITFQIGPNSLNELKLNTDLCTYDGNCWIRFTDSFIDDVSGNSIVPIIPNTIDTFHQPQIFTPDVTPPTLTSFTVDLDAGSMTFTFDEVIRLGTFTPMNITFQNSEIPTSMLNLREYGQASRRDNGLVIDWNMTVPDFNLLKSYEYVFSSFEDSYVTHSNFVEDISGTGIGFRSDALRVSEFIPDTTRPVLQSFKAFNFDNWTLTLQFNEPVNLSSIDLDEFAISRNKTLDLRIYDRIPINDWYSVLFENGTVYNLTHTFDVGEYLLSCPFSLVPTTESSILPPTMTPSIFGSGSGSGSGSGNGSGYISANDTLVDEQPTIDSTPVDHYPILLRGCRVYRNLTVVEPFYFLTGGVPTYVDERKQQVNIAFNRMDLRFLKLSFIIASNDSDTWIAFNDTGLSDMSDNPVIPTNLFNATKLEDGGFVDDETPPVLEFIELDMDSSLLSLHFSDVMDVQSVQPLLIEISEFPESNNSYTLQGPYPYPMSLTVDQQDNYTIYIPLSFDDMNALKNNLNLATSELNTYISFPGEIGNDIYGRNPMAIEPTQVRRLIPDETGPILVGFGIDYENRFLNLTFDEVVNPNTVVHAGITIQNMRNLSDIDEARLFEFHTFVEGGPPVDNSTGVSTLQLLLDLDLNALIIASDLGTDLNNSFITIDTATVLDMNNNPSQRVNNESAIQVSMIVSDNSSPELLYYDLNLNDNFLLLKFSESVRLETLNISAISLQSTQNYSQDVTADVVALGQDSLVIPMGFNSILRVLLSLDDQEAIKDPRSLLAKSNESTFLTIEQEAAENYVGLRVLSISQDNALSVREYFEGLLE